jgi:hypothetical protein
MLTEGGTRGGNNLPGHRRPRTILLVVAILALAAPAFAQAASAHVDRPLFLVGGQYGAPTRSVATAGILIAPARPFKAGAAPDSSRVGFVLTGGVGTGGIRVAAGGAALALEGPFLTTGFDALFTMTRTGETPRGAARNSTCVGGEAALVIMSVRLSAGIAHRTAGTAGPKATIVTWGVGVQVPLGW